MQGDGEDRALTSSIRRKLRKKFGANLSDGAMPRTVSLVTGPSRSADIGKILLMGAHGPKRLHIILVDGSPEAHQPN